MRLGVVLQHPPGRVGLLAQLCERAGIDCVWVPDTAALSVASGTTSRPRLGCPITRLEDLERLAAAPRPIDFARLDLDLADGIDAARVRELAPGARLAMRASSTGAAQDADDVVADADRVAQAIELVRASGRDPLTIGVAVEVPVSVGRTRAEAHARAAMDVAFETSGAIVGTLEECQDRVIALAHAGVTDLRCRLPNTPDVHDVIAQLTAMVIGSLDVLAPGAPRSKAPDPPAGWGGRRR